MLGYGVPELRGRRHRLVVDGDHDVSALETPPVSRLPRIPRDKFWTNTRLDTDITDVVSTALRRQRRDGPRLLAPASQQLDGHRTFRPRADGDKEVLPGCHRAVGNRHDAVAGADVRLRGRRSGRYGANDGRLVLKHRRFGT